MARCDNCKHFQPTVFAGTSASGYGRWFGFCGAGVDRGEEHHNLYMACAPKFERGVNALDRLANPKALPDHRPYQYALMAFENEGGRVVPNWQDSTHLRSDPTVGTDG
jgi:hypothetical protein